MISAEKLGEMKLESLEKTLDFKRMESMTAVIVWKHLLEFLPKKFRILIQLVSIQ